MWGSKSTAGRKEESNGMVAVAIDKDKTSQSALRWSVENLLGRGRPVVLIHVINNSSVTAGEAGIVSTITPNASADQQYVDKQTKDLFLTFRCFCTRKDGRTLGVRVFNLKSSNTTETEFSKVGLKILERIRCIDVTLKNTDVAKALIEYVTYAAIESLVLGNSKGGLLRRLKQTDVPTTVMRGAPDFCSVYVISKSLRIASVCNSTRTVPHTSPLHSQSESIGKETKPSAKPVVDNPPRRSLSIKGERSSCKPQRDHRDMMRSDRVAENIFPGDFPEGDTDLSFVGSERTSIDLLSPVHYDYMDPSQTPRLSTFSDFSPRGSLCFGQNDSLHDFSFASMESGRTSTVSSQLGDEVDAEMKRLKLELKQTMEMYSEACKEAVLAKEKEKKQTMQLHRWRLEEEKRLEENGTPEEAAIVRHQRKHTGREDEDISSRFVGTYRKYSIEDIEEATNNFSKDLKIGEGGYGPVYKCYLDHTRVAVKVLRPDATQGMTQFQQEVEVLSCIRHPNMVLLLGACPEYGCLVYEYMANGSLEDCLFFQGNTRPLSWQVRFRIASEVATGLHFLHQTKPEPLVHRDLKPGNILLDRYFVSKIADVGLARLVPPSVANNITQYRMTSTAGTFCYIDPEYQQTGMLNVKSDIYSLGIVLLQMLTARPPMGLAHLAETHIENGTFAEILDPSIPDWPMEEAISIAKLAVQCAEMQRKHRPDLGKVILPELARLRDFADDRMQPFMFYTGPSPAQSQTSMSQGWISNPMIGHSAASSSDLPSNASLS